jgi:predicted nucleic acid-binding protein
MKKQPIRIYVDTSVFGGVFDEEFFKPSRIFFEQVKAGKFKIVTSIVVRKEIEAAPKEIRDFFVKLAGKAEIFEITKDAVQLQNQYIDAEVVSAKWNDDALHVALATVSGCGLIVSWNFKHIVNFKKIPLYNGVNKKNGYPAINIHSPSEVIEDEK